MMSSTLPTIRRLHQAGFTLVELAIVIIIIGLLAGIVTVGRSLIHQAELKGVMEEINSHITNAKIFRQIYGYYPGDMPRASNFWLNATTCPAGPTPAGCNGDGDELIASHKPPSDDERGERHRAWQHMVLAELMQGNFTGLTGAAGSDVVDATNAPLSVKDGGSYYFIWDNMNGGYFSSSVQLLCFGGLHSTSPPKRPILTPIEAMIVDKRLDDGLPRNGYIRANNSSGDGNCVENAAYEVSYGGTACRICVAFDAVNVEEE